MSDIKKQENIEALRQRLYARDVVTNKIERHALTPGAIDVTRQWQSTGPTPPPVAPAAPVPEPEPPLPVSSVAEAGASRPRPKRRYRLVVLLVSFLILLGGVGFSAFYFFSGNNEISSGNISIALNVPAAIGGGEVLAFQVGVTNQNDVPIESATLIVKYPEGAQSVTGTIRELYEERIPIDTLAPGEARNIPVEAAIFGEEGAEKSLSATLEYRIAGSNGTFYKDSEPVLIRITSTPLILRVTALETVASGQLVDVKIVGQSNASSPLTNIIVRAEYPNSFDFERSTPAPSYGDEVWVIKEIKPAETFEINLKGIVSGLSEETFRINVVAGPAAPDNQYVMASRLTQGWVDMTIEQPFIDIKLAINDNTNDVVTIPFGQSSSVDITLKNTLDETVYDVAVEVVPGGNALNERSIYTDNGFFDSNTGTIRWEVANNPNFSQLLPGDTRLLTFDVNPVSGQSTASFDLAVNVYARRISDTEAQEQLIGTATIEARYSSQVALASQISYGGGGPVPPVVGTPTTYRATFVAEAGVNDVVDAVVSARLPLYVTWRNEYEGDGELTYNPTAKEISWRAGDITTGARKEMTVALDFLPSTSQIDTVPVLVNTQQMRANDRFTNDVLQATAPALTTQLSTEQGYGPGSGQVRGN
jgi:hypothetical protein